MWRLHQRQIQALSVPVVQYKLPLFCHLHYIRSYLSRRPFVRLVSEQYPLATSWLLRCGFVYHASTAEAGAAKRGP
jgi:hypothetical protein